MASSTPRFRAFGRYRLDSGLGYAHDALEGINRPDRIIGMTGSPLHTAATDHLPVFITAPGQTDVMMVVMAIVLLGAVVGFGVFFFRLHSLPERWAHGRHKVQFEIVAVLCLIALFTHIHLFWVAALILAMIEFPDIGGWLGRIAGSVEKIAETGPGKGVAAAPVESAAGASQNSDAAQVREEPVARTTAGADPVAVSAKTERRAPAGTRS
jgi:multisubunit Na+/H+ antiporter MnhF subunit